MKMMFQTLVDCGHELGTILEETASSEEIIEIKYLLARYSTDIISSCAFGIQCNCLKDPDAEFRQWGRKIFQPSIRMSTIRSLRPLIPSLIRMLKLRSTDPEISKYFRNMVKDTVNYREDNNIKRNDFMQLLIQIKNKGEVEENRSYLQQNGYGNLENSSGENGMFALYLLHVNKHILSCSSGGSASIEALPFPTRKLYMTISKVICTELVKFISTTSF
jgi:hypothetical protein